MLTHSPRIITDGLVLCLDAANKLSYPGSGTVWSDLTKPDASLSVVQVLVVAGGGGGGMDMGGGGGGGGVLYSSSYTITLSSAITVTVGNGGAGAPAGGTNGQPSGHQFTISATQGENSIFGALTAIGGGFGGSSYWGFTPNFGYGGTGGSGGGASGYKQGIGSDGRGGTGTSGQGFNGGGAVDNYYSGGGGGAGSTGVSGPNQPNGGIGVENSILGVSYFWGGGGGGASYSLSTGGNGGHGGGGGGAVGTTVGGSGLNPGSPGGGGNPNSQTNTPGGDAGANTGGGGGGGSHYNINNKGGNGGSGIVVVRYVGPQKATGGTVTSVDGDTVHTFTTSGTFTPNLLPATEILTNGVGFNAANAGSLTFDGVDDYVSSSFATTSNQSVTYAGWLYSTETTATYRNFIDSITVNPMIWWNTSGQIEFDAALYTTSAVYRNQWVYVALSKPSGSSSASYYVNGVLAGTGSAYTTPALTPTLLNRGGGQTWKGNCSNIQIYNRALTPTEILQNYNATKGRYNL